ncbi:MAG TPA: AMP-binding protein [Acidimicrobiales bacterium]|nr:AMP-binding protein [Acidimicrobiales bacterium]
MSDTSGATDAPAAVDPRIAFAMGGMIIAWWAEQHPDYPAFLSPAGNRTFAELNGRANQLVRALRRRGVVASDSAALLSSNRPEFSEVTFATQRSGLRLTPVNWHLSGEEAGYIVDDCEATVLVADARHAASAVAAAGLAPGAVVRLAVGGEIEDFESYEDAVSAEDDSNIEDPVMGRSMLYTSGTTGRPKGVDRPAAGVAAAAGGAAGTARAIFDYKAGEDLHLLTGPLYHAAPLAFSHLLPLLSGAGVVAMDHWDPEEALRLIEAHRITHTHMVPTMFVQLLKLAPEVRSRYDLSSLRSVLHGAAPCAVHIKRALIEWLGPVVFEYYAATEGTGTWVDSATWLSKPGTVGKIEPPDQVKVGDEDGNELPRNEVGTVFLKAPDVGRFRYFKAEDKTDSAYRGDYYTLGDVGFVDDDGFLFLTDRSADLIISGGVNIYPAEVDAVLLEHPRVADVATIGVPNEEWGEEVKTIVELLDGSEGSPELAAELIEFARSKLAHYKCPRSIDFVAALPRQDNGKIYKRVIRDAYRARAAGSAQSA